MDRLSVIFAGTGGFGVPTLEALAKNDSVKIPFVITGQDKPSGRKLQVKPSPIKEAAIKNNLIVHQPMKIAQMKQKIMQEKPDFLLVVAYGEIISSEVFQMVKYGAVNIHPSLLPKYRGASPIQETLLRGDTKTGVTWISLSKRMDAGDIIAQEFLPISEDDDSPTLAEKLARLAAEKTFAILSACHGEPVESMTLRVKKQDERNASYCRKIRKEDGKIDVHRETAEEIIRKIKAYAEWPGCYIFWNGKRLKIVQARTDEQKISAGEIKMLNDGKILIGTQKGALLPIVVQPESKREMKIEEFLRGEKKIPKL